jgi:hypothetical protein
LHSILQSDSCVACSPSTMAGFYPIPPTITAEALTTVPQSLWSDKKTDWMTGMSG